MFSESKEKREIARGRGKLAMVLANGKFQTQLK